uniref:hypothetical protein n=1 Tax=Hafnia alvei TaxID=569 RepID=UPI00242C0751|nr:hypothetical protein [Hafnia alvei]
MKTYPNEDLIVENTDDFIKRLSLFNLSKQLQLEDKISLLKTCVREESYDWFEYADVGYSLLKVMIKVKMKYKRILDSDIAECISLFIYELRALLILNKDYALFLQELDIFSANPFYQALPVVILLVILATCIYVFS